MPSYMSELINDLPNMRRTPLAGVGRRMRMEMKMSKEQARVAKALDWREHTSSLPKEGVLYLKGQEKAELVARLKKAFGKVKIRDGEV